MRSWSAATALSSRKPGTRRLPRCTIEPRDAWEALLAIGEVAGGEFCWILSAFGREQPAAHTGPARPSTPKSIPRRASAKCCLPTYVSCSRKPGTRLATQLPTGKSNERYDPCSPAILPALVAMEGRPWAEYSRGNSLTARARPSEPSQGFWHRSGHNSPEPQADGKGLQARKLRTHMEALWHRSGLRASSCIASGRNPRP